MEIVNPWVLYIGIPLIAILIFLCFLKLHRKEEFKKGSKICEDTNIYNTPTYKKVYVKYLILKVLAYSALIAAIAIILVMLSRPANRIELKPELENRDIFLCMDVSDSVDELNLEICDKLIELVDNLKGERFGISIFNARSVLLVPLTTDYEYVKDTLSEMKEAFEYSYNSGTDFFFSFTNDTPKEVRYYKYEGTLCDYGSSFIGDGLASCLYNFDNLKEDPERSRLIIFSTDNELNGEPLISLKDAAKLCEKNNVKVYSIVPEKVADEKVFKKAVEDTGGKYYKSDNSRVVEKLLDDVHLTDTSPMEEERVIYQDNPVPLFIGLLVLIGLYIVLEKRLKV